MTAKLLAYSFALALISVFGISSTASATATVVINNTDGAGEGFNDPTVQPASPTNGCLAGETLGVCRLRVFTTAAAQWGQLLNSTVTITVDAGMNPLTCSGTQAVLGSAGPNSSLANFLNAPRTNTGYVQALANSLAGSDLSAATDITANFNIDLDNGTCLTGTTGWWYGTNPAIPAPNDRTPLLPVVFHEIGHGLGFTAQYNTTTGAGATGASTPAWGYYLYNVATGKLWKDMTNAERVASAIGDPNLVWTGPRTNKQSVKFLGPPATVLVNSPAAIAGYNNAQTAEFGANVSTNPVTGDVVFVNDAVVGAIDGTHPSAGTVNDGCELPFSTPVTGKIALVDRGYCTFVLKALNAQAAGAIGLIVANNVASGPAGMGGADATVTIASLGVTQALGTSIKANLPAPGVNVTLGVQNGAALAGTNSGCVRMFAPNPLQSGSSVSHFHSDAFPNLLMEPALNRSIFDKVDLTLPLFQDIGWKMTPENILFLDGFDNNPCQFVQP